jgi:hypothetical protein
VSEAGAIVLVLLAVALALDGAPDVIGTVARAIRRLRVTRR